MKKRIYKILLCLSLVSIIILGGYSIKASAMTNNEGNLSTQKTFKINSDVVFRGDFSSHSWYFNISKWWDANNVEVNINYTINQVIQEGADAYIVLEVNNVPFKSVRVSYNPNKSIQTIKTSIPSYLLKEGNNNFEVQGYLRVTQNWPCVDDVNPANWMTLRPDSDVVVHFKEKQINNSISNFPYPFLKNSDEKGAINEIVIPNKYTDGDVSSAMMLSSYLGGVSKNSTYEGQVVKYNDLDKNDNIIFISNYNGLPNELKKSIGSDDYKDNAIIKLINSPYSKDSNKKVLIIVSDNSDMLMKAVKFMMNKSLVAQISGDSYIVTSNTKEEENTLELQNKITFNELGVDGAMLKGPFRRTANLGYKLPKNRVLSNGGKVVLNIRYSKNLDFTKSLVTVFINGVPIGSKNLTMENANNDTVELSIPNDLKSSNYLNIEVAFDLELKDTWCEKRDLQTPWAYIEGTSYLYLPSIKNQNYYFNSYPNPFMKNNTLNNIALVVPENMSSKDLTNFGKMFSLMGEDLKYNTGNIVTVTANNVDSVKKDYNLIVYGTPNNNEFIKKLNDDLFFKYNDNYTAFESNPKQFLTAPFNSQMTTFQMVKSPFNSQMGLMILTSPNEESLRNSMSYLTSGKKVYDLTGDSIIIGPNGDIQNFKMVKPTDDKPVFESLKNANMFTVGFIFIFGLVSIFIIVSAILYFNKYKNMKKNDSDKRIGKYRRR